MDKEIMEKRATLQVDRASMYKRVFETEDGKKVLYDLMKFCNMLQPCFVKGDPYESTHNDGQRSVALFILTQMNVDTEALLKLIKQGEENDKEYAEDFYGANDRGASSW